MGRQLAIQGDGKVHVILTQQVACPTGGAWKAGTEFVFTPEEWRRLTIVDPGFCNTCAEIGQHQQGKPKGPVDDGSHERDREAAMEEAHKRMRARHKILLERSDKMVRGEETKGDGGEHAS